MRGFLPATMHFRVLNEHAIFFSWFDHVYDLACIELLGTDITEREGSRRAKFDRPRKRFYGIHPSIVNG